MKYISGTVSSCCSGNEIICIPNYVGLKKLHSKFVNTVTIPYLSSAASCWQCAAYATVIPL
jgi:hypothetical protein